MFPPFLDPFYRGAAKSCPATPVTVPIPRFPEARRHVAAAPPTATSPPAEHKRGCCGARRSGNALVPQRELVTVPEKARESLRWRAYRSEDGERLSVISKNRISPIQNKSITFCFRSFRKPYGIRLAAPSIFLKIDIEWDELQIFKEPANWLSHVRHL